ADGALMVVDSSRPCPGPQTVQHTNAAYVLGVLTNDYTDQPKVNNYEKYTKVIVSQNKIDLVEEKEACLHYESIKNFLRSYSNHLAIETPILPISAQSKLNIDALLMIITKRLPPYSARLIPRQQTKSVVPLLTISNKFAKSPLDDQELRINIIRSFDVNRGMELKEATDVDKIQG
ncbi:Translation initiation factor 2 gamma subunit, partial [Reticulomyxa filosa]